MPRYIDADALYNAFENACWYDNDDRDFVAEDVLMDAPTVDAVPVVRGGWLVTDAYPHRVYCSLCYKTSVYNEETLFEKNEYPHFCMWCGARMDGES